MIIRENQDLKFEDWEDELNYMRDCAFGGPGYYQEEENEEDYEENLLYCLFTEEKE